MHSTQQPSTIMISLPFQDAFVRIAFATHDRNVMELRVYLRMTAITVYARSTGMGDVQCGIAVSVEPVSMPSCVHWMRTKNIFFVSFTFASLIIYIVCLF